jgi:hypothetical protein
MENIKLIHEESLKAKTAESIHPSEKRKIREFVMKDESLRHWVEENVEDMNNDVQVNYFIREHAIELASAINHKLQVSSDGKEMSVQWDTASTDASRAMEENNMRGIEGSLKALKAAPEFQMEMQLGDVLPPPYEQQIELYITELLKQQTELSIPLPEGFTVAIPDFGSDYHADNEPMEGFPGEVTPHAWYCSGKFEIIDSSEGYTVGYGDFSVDGLWNPEDSEVIGNSLTVLNLRPASGDGQNRYDEPALSAHMPNEVADV